MSTPTLSEPPAARKADAADESSIQPKLGALTHRPRNA